MTEWTAADLPSFAGRTVIVTGANSGLGEVTARELARVGARVILAVRDTGKGETAAAAMSGDVAGRELDLADLSSVRRDRKSTRLDASHVASSHADVGLKTKQAREEESPDREKANTK